MAKGFEPIQKDAPGVASDISPVGDGSVRRATHAYDIDDKTMLGCDATALKRGERGYEGVLEFIHNRPSCRPSIILRSPLHNHSSCWLT